MEAQAYPTGELRKFADVLDDMMLSPGHFCQVIEYPRSAHLFSAAGRIVNADRVDLDLPFLDLAPQFALGEPTVIVPTIRNEKEHLPPILGLMHLANS